MKLTQAEQHHLDNCVLFQLMRSAHGKSKRPSPLTAYQILNRLPPKVFDQITENGKYLGGRGRGSSTRLVGSQIVQRSLSRLAEGHLARVVGILDSQGLRFNVRGTLVEAGYPPTALYQAVVP